MLLTQTQKDEFEVLVKNVIKWLNDNTHPHTTVVIDATHAELSEGICAVTTTEFVKD